MKFIVYFNLLCKRIIKDSPLRLEFGCGPSLKPGFEGVDIRWFPGVRYICNSWKIGKYVKKESVTEIYSRHFLEHLTFAQVDLTLEEWSWILEKGGMVEIIVPDLDYHISQWIAHDGSRVSEVNPAWTLREHAIAGFWGWQREGDSKFWDVHKCGFNFETLRDFLEKHRFQRVCRIKSEPWNLHVQALKS